MSTPILLVVGLLAVAVVYVLAPVAGHAYSRFRSRRTVTCPETGEPASVLPDAGHAALTAAFGPPDVRLAECSRWPEREDCGQGCREDIG